MEYATVFDIPLIEHCETPELHPGGVMNEGYWSTALGLRGIPRASEEISVDRNVVLAEMTGARFHVAHLSTSGALRQVRDAKARGLAVTCEVTPHHLVLTDESVRSYDTQPKMKPPLVTESDRAALLEGLADGTVDAIATDHAPHHVDEKSEDFDHAPFGIVGLETAVSLCLDRLVRPGVISLARLVELMSTAPARVLGVGGGTLAPGAPADVTLIDLEKRVRVDPEAFVSLGRNTPIRRVGAHRRRHHHHRRWSYRVVARRMTRAETRLRDGLDGLRPTLRRALPRHRSARVSETVQKSPRSRGRGLGRVVARLRERQDDSGQRGALSRVDGAQPRGIFSARVTPRRAALAGTVSASLDPSA